MRSRLALVRRTSPSAMYQAPLGHQSHYAAEERRWDVTKKAQMYITGGLR